MLFSETLCYQGVQKMKKVGYPNLPPRQSIHFESNRMTVKIRLITGIILTTLLFFEQVTVKVGYLY